MYVSLYTQVYKQENKRSFCGVTINMDYYFFIVVVNDITFSNKDNNSLDSFSQNVLLCFLSNELLFVSAVWEYILNLFLQK